MNLHEYELIHFPRYQAFTDVVRTILEKAIAAAGDLPRPQSIQGRAKTPESLRKRLEEAGDLEADVAKARRDLAGVRIIFYTNNDVERFLNSSIVFDNFEVDRGSTKIHHPVEENGHVRYQAIHYTVSLNSARAVLPEYGMFADMRCEIQIQTILIHAWSETSHDIIYKVDDRDGFGNEAQAQIKKRFARIMDKYLIPAGYEFQRVQQDYKRLVAGKQLFDQNLLESLRDASDNNERYDLLSSLSDDLLPLYDDIPSVFPEIVDVLIGVVTSARNTPTKPRDIAFSSFAGSTAEDITEKVVEVIQTHRYAAIEKAYLGLQAIFIGEANERIRKKIVEAVGHLAEYNLKIWEQGGPIVQQRLVTLLDSDKNASLDAFPIHVEVWKHLLDAEASGTEWRSDSVSLQSGEVPIAAVSDLRQAALTALFKWFETVVDDHQRRAVVNALENAARAAARSAGRPEFLRQSLIDHAAVIAFYTERADQISYELRETIEHSALYAYFRAEELQEARSESLGAGEEGRLLSATILEMRDRFNSDETFVRYKILVGFEGVFPQQWDDEEFDHSKIEAYRDAQADALLEEVTDASRAHWLEFLQRCAATRSEDAATFPKLGEFIVKLSSTKPSIARYLLDQGNEDLLRFLPGFLNGLIKSGDAVAYRASLERFLSKQGYLLPIAMHWRGSSPDDPGTLKVLVERAIAGDDRAAVAECLAFAMRSAPAKVPPRSDLVWPALRHLIAVKDGRWVNLTFLPERTAFFESLTHDDTALILESLVELPRLNWNAERIISYLADQFSSEVWDFIGRRLEHPKEEADDFKYEAVPHRFQILTKHLSSDAPMAVSKARGWFGKNSSLFGYRGGRVLSSIFANCPPAFASELVRRIEHGTMEDAKFVLGVVQNYHGEASTHPALKALLRKFPGDDHVETGVARSIENTGVVHGEFGFVDSLREKKLSIEPWLDDVDEVIVRFARKEIADIDRDILAEKRRADARVALRELEYQMIDEDIDDVGSAG